MDVYENGALDFMVSYEIKTQKRTIKGMQVLRNDYNVDAAFLKVAGMFAHSSLFIKFLKSHLALLLLLCLKMELSDGVFESAFLNYSSKQCLFYVFVSHCCYFSVCRRKSVQVRFLTWICVWLVHP